MKIGIDIRHLATSTPSGVGLYTLHVVKELIARHPEDQFLLLTSGSAKTQALLPDFSFPNAEIHAIPLRNRILSLLLLLPFGPSLEDFLAHPPEMWWFPNLNIIRTRLPYVLTVHDLSFQIFPEFFTWKTRLWHRLSRFERLVNQSRKILTVSKSTASDLQTLYRIPKDKIFVTPLGVETYYHANPQPSDENFRRQHGITFPYFLTLCSLEPRKNIESVVEAYDAWKSEQEAEHHALPAEHLVIAGKVGWKTGRLKKVIAAARHQKDIHLIGYVPEAHKPALYRGASAFLFPSFYEGFGLPVAEAIACQTPTIVSFTGSLPEVAGDAAIYVDPFNVTDLVQALTYVDLCAPFLQKQSQKRRAFFNWQETAKQTAKQLKNL